MKNLISVTLIGFLLASCTPWYKKEAIKSVKHGTASDRINSSAGNSEKILQELDQ